MGWDSDSAPPLASCGPGYRFLNSGYHVALRASEAEVAAPRAEDSLLCPPYREGSVVPTPSAHSVGHRPSRGNGPRTQRRASRPPDTDRMRKPVSRSPGNSGRSRLSSRAERSGSRSLCARAVTLPPFSLPRGRDEPRLAHARAWAEAPQDRLGGRGKAGRSQSRVSAEDGAGAPVVHSSGRPRHSDQACAVGATASRQGLARASRLVKGRPPGPPCCPGHHLLADPRRCGRSGHLGMVSYKDAVIL